MNEPGAVTELLHSLQRTLAPRWEFQHGESTVRISHRDAGTPYHPARRVFCWTELLQRLEEAFLSVGVRRSRVLPLCWRRDTDLTISAVQALDPYLKHRQPYVYREGYLPQPVVRFTGKRDEQGRLVNGFLTSFVNTSHVRRVSGPGDIAIMLDQWLTVLSQLRLHARHLCVHARKLVWHRKDVAGVTLHYDYAGRPLGDLVWIWNQDDPAYTVGDLGTGLERLAWIMTNRNWSQLVFDRLTHRVDPTTLDAIRTATLIAMSGIRPAARGPGTALRRVLHRVAPDVAARGLDEATRFFYNYWHLTARTETGWPYVSTILMSELRHQARTPREPSAPAGSDV